MYNNFSNSSYSWEDYSSESNANKYLRRHTNVNSYFSNNPSKSFFSLLGKQLGLSNTSANYKVYKFISGNQITVTDSYNYIPVQTQNNYIII